MEGSNAMKESVESALLFWVRPYKYDLLEPGQIRVLVLYPGAGADPLCGTLETVRLDEDPGYEAISYAWGEPDFVHELRLDRGVLKLTTSLYGALRRFRDAENSVRLWADAVCINQQPDGDHDLAEKNHQVAMMGEIYSKAEEVLIWLGEAKEQDTMFFWLLDVLATLSWWRDAQWDQFEGGGMDSMPFPPDDTVEPSCSCCDLRFQLVEASWNEGLSSIAKFWDKPWFQRLWVVQEKSRARLSTIFCGSHQIRTTVLLDAQSYLRRYFFRRQASSAHNGRLFRVIELLGWIPVRDKEFSYPGPIGELLDTLVSTRHLESRLPHDRLFAIKGICPILDKVLPSSDYSMPEYVLWQSVTTALITDEKNWRGRQLSGYDLNAGFLLVMAGMQRNDPRSTLPSWVPDYGRIPELADRLWAKHSHMMDTPGSRAGGDMLEGNVPTFMESNGMAFKGVILGEIREIALDSVFPGVEVVFQKGLTAWTLDDLLPWIRNCEKFAVGPDAPGRGGDKRDTLKLLLPSIEGTWYSGIGYLNALERLLVMPGKVNDARSARDESDDEEDSVVGVIENPWTCHFDFHKHNAGALLAKSSGGQSCWIPPHAMVGDQVCLLSGADVPFIIRPDDKGRYRLVGDAYVHGVMYGEAWPGELGDSKSASFWVKGPVQKLPPEDMKPILDIVLI